MRNKSYIDQYPVESAFYSKIKRLGLINIELSERCNNNCRHCYIIRSFDPPHQHKKELSAAALKGYLRDFASFGWFVARFTGGEPLLRPDFEELYIYARELGFKVVLSTNACLITERLARLFRRIPLLEEIDITLYGMSRGPYEAVSRASGSFDAATKGIKILLKNKIPFLVNFSVLPFNMHEVGRFRKWHKKMFPSDRFPVINVFLDRHVRRDPFRNDCINDLRLSPEQGLRVIPSQKADFVRDMQYALNAPARAPDRRLFSCGAGKGGLCLDPYGKLYPCLSLRHPKTEYDLINGSIREAYDSFFPAMRRMTVNSPAYLARCARCFLKPACSQCPAKSWMENGVLDSPAEYFCGVAHAQAVSLGLLREKEKSWEVKDWRTRVRKFLKGAMDEKKGGSG